MFLVSLLLCTLFSCAGVFVFLCTFIYVCFVLFVCCLELVLICRTVLVCVALYIYLWLFSNYVYTDVCIVICYVLILHLCSCVFFVLHLFISVHAHER